MSPYLMTTGASGSRSLVGGNINQKLYYFIFLT